MREAIGLPLHRAYNAVSRRRIAFCIQNNLEMDSFVPALPTNCHILSGSSCFGMVVFLRSFRWLEKCAPLKAFVLCHTKMKFCCFSRALGTFFSSILDKPSYRYGRFPTRPTRFHHQHGRCQGLSRRLRAHTGHHHLLRGARRHPVSVGQYEVLRGVESNVGRRGRLVRLTVHGKADNAAPENDQRHKSAHQDHVQNREAHQNGHEQQRRRWR